MSEEIEEIYSRMGKQEQELINLRQGYIIVNERYNESLSSLRKLSDYASESAMRSSMATENALIAAKKAADAATTAAMAASASETAARAALEANKSANAAADYIRDHKK